MQPDSQDITSVLTPEVWWTLVGILAVAVIGAFIVWYIRRWARQSEATPPGGFTLGALRKMKQEGKISEEEYKRTSELLAKVQRDKLLAPKPDLVKKNPEPGPAMPKE
jgi:hypothetical protein